MTSDTLKVLIVRHGQTNYNKKHILQGHVGKFCRFGLFNGYSTNNLDAEQQQTHR